MSIEELHELGIEATEPLPSDDGVEYENEQEKLFSKATELNFDKPE